MSRGYCCFRSLLCLSHYLVPSHKMFDLWSYGEDIQLFRERLSEKMYTRQSRRAIWDIINTPFLTLQLSNLRLLLSLSSSQTHKSMASHAILSNFFEEQCIQNHPQYLSGLSCALFPTTLLEIAVYMYQANFVRRKHKP